MRNFYQRDKETRKFLTRRIPFALDLNRFKDRFSFLCVSVPLWLVLLLTGCSVPNLEPPACNESRTAVREFYSFHFGNDMNFSQETLKQREKFLTPELLKHLELLQENADPFTTGTNDFPKAFRVGECKEISSDRTQFQLLLFWRDDTRSEQREIMIEAAKQNEKWMIDKISTK